MRARTRSDYDLMTEYVCHRIPQAGTRIVLFPAGPEGGEVWADLTATWGSKAGWDLHVETNLPEWVSLAEIYSHFRHQDMTSMERQQLLCWGLYRHNLSANRQHGPGPAMVPRWDADLGRLWCGDHLIKEYREEAENQKAVIAAFQEEGWRHRIDDPLPGVRDKRRAKRRLRDTITGLNQDHLTSDIMRFRGDGTGKGVRWYLTQ